MEYKFKFRRTALEQMKEYNVTKEAAIDIIVNGLKSKNAYQPTIDYDKDVFCACVDDKERSMLFQVHLQNYTWIVTRYRKSLSSLLITVDGKTTLLFTKDK